MSPAPKSIAEQLSHVRSRLTSDFGSEVDAKEVDQIVEIALKDLGTPKVTTYVPVLVEKAARQRLRVLVAH